MQKQMCALFNKKIYVFSAYRGTRGGGDRQIRRRQKEFINFLYNLMERCRPYNNKYYTKHNYRRGNGGVGRYGRGGGGIST